MGLLDAKVQEHYAKWSLFPGLAPRCRHRVSVRPKVPGPPPTAQDRQKLTAFLHFSTPAGGK